MGRAARAVHPRGGGSHSELRESTRNRSASRHPGVSGPRVSRVADERDRMGRPFESRTDRPRRLSSHTPHAALSHCGSWQRLQARGPVTCGCRRWGANGARSGPRREGASSWRLGPAADRRYRRRAAVQRAAQRGSVREVPRRAGRPFVIGRALSAAVKILLSWSTGKDSAWALHVLRQQYPDSVAALLTTTNEAFDRVAMHAVRRELLEAQAAATGLPLTVVPLPWLCSNEEYERRMAESVAGFVA